MVPRSPSAVLFVRPGVFPAKDAPHASASGCADPDLGPPSKSLIPQAPSPPASRQGVGSPKVSLPTTRSNTADPVHPGLPRPGTFRPQGLTTLPTVCSPSCLALARQPAQRPWDSPFRALLLPVSGAPLGTSPLLSFARPVHEERSDCDSRGLLRPGRGSSAPCAETQKTSNLALLGIRPSRAFSSAVLNRLPGSRPSCPSGRKRSLRYISGRGFRGLSTAQAAGLPRDCQPSWGFAPCRVPRAS